MDTATEQTASKIRQLLKQAQSREWDDPETKKTQHLLKKTALAFYTLLMPHLQEAEEQTRLKELETQFSWAVGICQHCECNRTSILNHQQYGKVCIRCENIMDFWKAEDEDEEAERQETLRQELAQQSRQRRLQLYATAV